jgi:hypothetical protein
LVNLQDLQEPIVTSSAINPSQEKHQQLAPTVGLIVTIIGRI